MIYLVLVLLIVGFVFDAERDTIQFRPSQSWFPYSKYWTEKNWKLPWLVKLLPIWDGWHICKAVYQFSIYWTITLLWLGLEEAWWMYLVYVMGINFFYGIVFESSYGNEYL